MQLEFWLFSLHLFHRALWEDSLKLAKKDIFILLTNKTELLKDYNILQVNNFEIRMLLCCSLYQQLAIYSSF